MAENNWIYSNNEDNTSRYLLGVEGEKTIFCFGVNPSTAEPNAADATIRKVTKIAQHNNYDSWMMLNVYPVRATKFDDLTKKLDVAEHNRNIETIKNVLSNHKKADIWLAFGNHIFHRDYLKKCFVEIYESLSEFEINWYATKVNKSQAPAHPLYQKNESEFIKFDTIEEFIEELKN